MEKMIQKSVRMPSSIVDFVDMQSGSDFSKKLVGVLVEYRDGDIGRRLMLQRYDEQISERRNRLSRILDDISALSRIHGRVLDLVHEVELLELFAPGCPEPPERESGSEPSGQESGRLEFLMGLQDDFDMPFG